MSEEFKEFKAKDYVKTESDIKELIKAAMDEDLGDGTVIRAVLKHVAQNKQPERPRTRHRPKPRQPLRRPVGRRQPHSGNPAEDNSFLGVVVAP